MDPRRVALILIAIGAVIAVAGLAIGLHGVATGRLANRWVVSLYRSFGRVPATPEDIRRNGFALVLNDFAVLLIDVELLAGLLLPGSRFDRTLQSLLRSSRSPASPQFSWPS